MINQGLNLKTTETKSYPSEVLSFMHPEKCNLCGVEFDDKDDWMWMQALETYSVRRDRRKFVVVKAQWHVRCINGRTVH